MCISLERRRFQPELQTFDRSSKCLESGPLRVHLDGALTHSISGIKAGPSQRLYPALYFGGCDKNEWVCEFLE